ncbi:MerR family transcriptional regulator [Streptomyces antnestii]|uniref:MerR family transcriptional regulator n=1 Tax=Streptomyces antnestii TaxID=2494256 RepID=A0A3S2Z3I8_9ACTN|nr:MerR family transcriptional regulator [Streptomyces sp. San01]RVU27815.1 MerR family transcriptional regulator [Streptomyces sp. San01]
MPADSAWSIGELAERAGVTVKTVRFYSDRGLLPEGARSTGGHRRYGPEALDRLRVIRSLRALDLPVPDVSRVLAGDGEEAAQDVLDDVLEGVIAGRLRDVGSQLAALRWRQAALQLLQDCAPAERAERLLLVGAVSAPPSTDATARFWRRWLPPRMPAGVVAAVVDEAVPQLPDEPTPAHVLAFARLHAFTSRSCDGGDRGQPAAHRTEEGFRPAVLYEGLREAYALASPGLRAGRAPHGGEALDCFVSAYAASRGVRDTPSFRRRLSAVLAADPRIDHYWRLAAELAGPSRPTAGAAHDWLCAALDGQVARRSL